jgi:hypothetical protein
MGVSGQHHAPAACLTHVLLSETDNNEDEGIEKVFEKAFGE